MGVIHLIKRVIKNNLGFILILALLLILNQRYDAYYVQSGSMEPEIRVGAIVVVDSRKMPEKGDIGAYISGGNIIIHRVVDSGAEGFTFKGDANPDPDPVIVANDRIRGTVTLTLNAAVFLTRKLGLVR